MIWQLWGNISDWYRVKIETEERVLGNSPNVIHSFPRILIVSFSAFSFGERESQGGKEELSPQISSFPRKI